MKLANELGCCHCISHPRNRRRDSFSAALVAQEEGWQIVRADYGFKKPAQ